MSAVSTSVIVCAGCERKFTWKPELAGKRVKCKCGQAIQVAAAPAVVPRKFTPAVKPIQSDPDDLDGLFALAQDAERAAAALPIEVREVPDPVVETTPQRKKSNVVRPPGNQTAPNARATARARELEAAFTDPIRDIYAPNVILAIGFALYISYFIVRFHLPSAAMGSVGTGVLILTVIKAACLVGFALFAATPLGVSFGGLHSAVLKLAAIAVFADGAVAWVDMGIGKISGGVGGGGVFGFGMVGWPVTLGIYWGMLIYLFSMDPADSWLVVVCLSVFDRIVRIVLLVLLLETFLSWGGVAVPAAAGAASRHAARIHASEISTEVDQLKEADALIEAKKYIQDGHQAILTNSVNNWYAAGCPNVWFAMTNRDINGKRSATGVIVEMPQGKADRAKCYDILKLYYKDAGIYSTPADFVDTGEDYLNVMMR